MTEGTTHTITPTPDSTKPLPTPEVPRVSGTVLVVDDELGVCSVTALFLEQAGFTALRAADGQAGLAAFRARRQEIVAAVLDLVMPRMGGLELADALRRLRPDIPLILMSGYSADEVMSRYAGQGFAAYLQKPFGQAALLAAVKQAIGQ